MKKYHPADSCWHLWLTRQTVGKYCFYGCVRVCVNRSLQRPAALILKERERDGDSEHVTCLLCIFKQRTQKRYFSKDLGENICLNNL